MDGPVETRLDSRLIIKLLSSLLVRVFVNRFLMNEGAWWGTCRCLKDNSVHQVSSINQPVYGGPNSGRNTTNESVTNEDLSLPYN